MVSFSLTPHFTHATEGSIRTRISYSNLMISHSSTLVLLFEILLLYLDFSHVKDVSNSIVLTWSKYVAPLALIRIIFIDSLY